MHRQFFHSDQTRTDPPAPVHHTTAGGFFHAQSKRKYQHVRDHALELLCLRFPNHDPAMLHELAVNEARKATGQPHRKYTGKELWLLRTAYDNEKHRQNLALQEHGGISNEAQTAVSRGEGQQRKPIGRSGNQKSTPRQTSNGRPDR